MEIVMTDSDGVAYIRQVLGSGVASAAEIARRMAAAFLARNYVFADVNPDRLRILGQTEEYYDLEYLLQVSGRNCREFVVRVAKDGTKIECVSDRLI